MAGKAVAKKANTDVAITHDYAGLDDMTINDLSIPFINIMQTNSPEVEDELIPGVKPGDLVNSVTKEILTMPVVLIPVFKEAAVVEWVPRLKGGGIVDRHELDSEVFTSQVAANGGSRIPPKGADGKRISFKSPAGNDLVETYYVYCLLMDPTCTEPEGYVVLSFSSTKIKIHKDWMTSMYTQKGRPPIFANRCHLSTQRQKNEAGTFYNYKIAPMEDTWRASLIDPSTDEGQALLKEAQEFAKMIDDGLARPDLDSLGGTVEATGGPTSDSIDEDAPF